MTQEERRAYQRDWARKRRADPEFVERTRKNQMESYYRHKAKRQATSRQWKANNSERVSAYRRKWFEEHREQEYATHRNWVKANPERWRELTVADTAKHGKARRDRRKPKRNEKARLRYASDENYRIEKRIRARVWQALRRVAVSKCDRIEALIGCTIPELRAHLEQQFSDGMTWCPRLHIDHIRPVASFDLTDPSQQCACFHFTNLQPLWGHANRAKGAKHPCCPPPFV